MVLALACSHKPRTNIKNPILLVPGYSSKSVVWETTGLVNYMQQKGLVYGGKLRAHTNNQHKIIPEKTIKGNVDFFSLSYSDSVQKIDYLEKELGLAIKYIRKNTNAKKVIIVAYSMGGLVSRDYLTNHYKRPYVSTLITIDSPHKGSFLADIAKTSSLLLSDKYTNYLSQNMDIPIDGKAINDLMSEESNQFLKKLNHAKHPQKITYVSIIGIEKNTSSINSYLKNQLGISTYEGDLVCSKDSQNMKNIEWFQMNPSMNTNEVIIQDVNHLTVLEHYVEIYKVLQKFIEPVSFRPNKHR